MYLSIMEKYFLVKVTHNLQIALMNETPPKRFSADFLLYLNIEQIDVQSLVFYIL